MSKIKILHLVDNWPNKLIPNSGVFLFNTIERLNKYGHNSENEVALVLKYNSKDTLRLIFNKRKIHYILPFFHKRIYKQSNIKLLFLFYFSVPAKHFSLKLKLLRMFTLTKIIKIVKNNKYDILHAHICTPGGYLAFIIKRLYKIPYIIHVHGRDVQEFDEFTIEEKNQIVNIYENANALVCNSTKTYNLVKKIVKKEENIRIIPFSVDVNFIKKTKTFDENIIKLVSVCNLKKVKSIADVINAINISNIKGKIMYDIIGYGEEYYELRKLINMYKLNNSIRLLGSLDNEDVLNILSDYDVFVLPSKNEAFGVAYLEALACGLPCIAIKGQGWEDIDPMHESIIPVCPDDITELKNALEYFYFEPEKRREMGLNGQKIVKNRYSVSIVNSMYESLYKQLFNNEYEKV